MLFRRMLMQKALPYDAEVEYLENNGVGAYINTNYIPTIGDEIATEFMEFNNSVNSVLFSAGFGTYQLIFLPSGNAIGAYVKYFASGSAARFQYAFGGQRFNVWFPLTVSSYGLFHIDGIVYTATSHPEQELDGTNKTLFLFVRSNLTTPFNGRIKYFTILNNGDKKLDLIPVRVGTTGYLYDKVSKQLFGNDGSGSFTVGPDKN